MKAKIALAQTSSCEEAAQNLKKAEKYIKEASEKKADVVIFPEIFLAAFPDGTGVDKKLSAAADIESPAVAKISGLAKEYGIWVVFGMYEPVFENGIRTKKNYNTTVIIDSDGNVKAAYHKTHLYDAFSYKESDYNAAGDELFTPIDTPFGRIGLMVCYEVRFPEIARHQAVNGAQVIIMPTAWFDGKGKRQQLDLAVRSRAMDNTVFVAMCDLCGGARVGESCISGPMGNIIAKAGSEEEMLVCEIDLEDIEKARKVIPVLENRRPELY